MRHILFPCDLSTGTQAAFQQLLSLAAPLRPKVTLMHSRVRLNAYEAQALALEAGGMAGNIENRLEELMLNQMQTFSRQLTGRRIDSEILLMTGKPGPQIIAAARRYNCDLILLGSRGLGPVSSFLLGSTSAYVVHHSACPVLVIPGGAENEAAQPLFTGAPFAQSAPSAQSALT